MILFHKISLLLISLAFFLFFPTQIFAHGSGGEFTEEKAGYKIDVGYESKELYANEPSNFDFKLFMGDEEAEYTDIWVRIVKENQTILATGIHNQDLGGTTLLYEFPESGNYTIHVRYQNNGESLVESEFPISVLDSEIQDNPDSNSDSNKSLIFIFGFVFALILGAVLGIIIGRTTKLLR